MNPMRVLVVEDDRELCEVMQEGLAREGFQVDRASSGQEALERATGSAYDVILLDVMIPRPDGYAVLAQLRKQGNRSAILMVTSRGEEKDKLKGLSGGADDYLVKPFLLTELVARIRAISRRISCRSGAPAGERLRAGDIEMDLLRREVRRAGQALSLTRTEFNLLELFLRNPGQVLSPSVLAQRLSLGAAASPNALEVHIKNLRGKIDRPPSPSLIRNVRGSGYVFDPSPK